MKVLFSVIIPTYNAQETIISILEQINKANFKNNIEIIIIDSSSIDKTVDRVKDYFCKVKIPNKIIRIPKKHFNHGLTRNLGVKNAKGKYVLFLSHDVNIEGRKIFKYLEEDFIKHKGIVVFGKQIPLKKTPFIQQLETRIIFEELDQHVNREGILLQNTKKPFVSYISDNFYLWYFLSDVCACYRRSYLLKNPFIKVETGEDIITGRAIIEQKETKIYDSRIKIYHSHSYNIVQYYQREKQEYKLVVNKLRLKKRVNIIYKIKKILVSDFNVIKKMSILIELVIYYLIKIVIYIKNRYEI